MHNQYEVIGIVGEGAYGIVYKCRNKETGEFVAIKKFKEIQDDIVKKTMARELRVLKLLKNENIVEYKGAFKRKENLFLVFEYVEKNLLELLQEHPKGLEPNLIKKIIYQLCKSINYLHEQNIIHRDIKPENLLIDSTHKLKLCDFGFARSFKPNKDNLTDYVATRWYRSPELLLTSGNYGTEVDNWAIGCIMGELTDGDPLFPGDDEVHQLIVIQKVLGNFSEEQYEQFEKNPHFSGCKLPSVAKPETLERRYSGKLSSQAINFMKLLLHPDPKCRLKGEEIFKHPYFENFNDPFPPKDLNVTRVDTKEMKISKKDSNNTQTFQSTPGYVHPNIINKSISLNSKPVGSHGHSVEKSNEKDYKENPNHHDKKKGGGGNANIHIYNYNNNNNNYHSNHESNLEKFDKLEKLEKEKNKKFTSTLSNFNYIDVSQHQHHSLSKGKVTSNKNSKNFASQENLIMTSSGFNKNLKDNILAIYGVTNYDNNFKTFYKGDKYNYDIDMNFKRNEERKNNSQQKKDTSNNKNKNTKNQKYNVDKFKTNYIIPEEGYENNTHSREFNMSKASPPKYSNIGGYHASNFKTKNNFYQNNIQLPTINKNMKKGYK